MRANDNDTCLREKRERERESTRAQERLPYIQIKSHFGYGEEDSKMQGLWSYSSDHKTASVPAADSILPYPITNIAAGSGT